ncbi:MAG: prepilin-type N-terminal cleavage/methylation domain-containing protein [Candidatus Sericytochromatia bacterium]|nr:prepilin-type N-terminal cleavage/methylation domain-containing protein [Candidatus Sericytochromatia bacterium]
MTPTARPFSFCTRNGFSLFEVLTATALVGLVMGLAMQGFSEAKKVGDLAKARITTRQEANSAVQKLAKVVRRAHIIFFDPRPLGQMATPETVALSNVQRDANLPGVLRDSAGGNSVNHRWTNPGNSTYITPFTGWTNQLRREFRGHGLNLATTAGTADTIQTDQFYLRTARLLSAGAPTANRFEHYFPSPLLYCAEAQFSAGRLQAAGGGPGVERMDAGLPVSWTFYVAYLAPMRLPSNAYATGDDGLLPIIRGNFAQRDQMQGSATRAPVPFELRLLTIPDVKVIRNATAQNGAPVRRLNTGRRADDTGVLPPPFDVEPNQCNYDPVPMPNLDTTYNLFSATSAGPWGNPSGARVRGTNRMHCNWDNVGNDPPTNDALGDRGEWDGTGYIGNGRPIRDQVLASYIDPDSIHGTSVRLGNDWVRDVNTGDIGLIARGENAPRPYVNATGGPQTYSPRFWHPDNPLTVGPPRRALISVATRFRYSRQTPFAFATESVEVELESLNRFQDMSFRFERR